MNLRRHFQLLCVEDNPSIRRMLKAVFERAGYDVETAPNGFTALQKVRNDPESFQLIITDLQMPELDGLGFIEQAHAAGYGGAGVGYAGTILRKERGRLTQLRGDRNKAKTARFTQFIGAGEE